MDEIQCLAEQLRKISILGSVMWERRILKEHFGLPRFEWDILKTVRLISKKLEKEEIPIGLVCYVLCCRHQVLVSRGIKRLENKKLAKRGFRKIGEKGRRHFFISLTKEGIDLAEKALDFSARHIRLEIIDILSLLGMSGANAVTFPLVDKLLGIVHLTKIRHLRTKNEPERDIGKILKQIEPIFRKWEEKLVEDIRERSKKWF